MLRVSAATSYLSTVINLSDITMCPVGHTQTIEVAGKMQEHSPMTIYCPNWGILGQFWENLQIVLQANLPYRAYRRGLSVKPHPKGHVLQRTPSYSACIKG